MAANGEDKKKIVETDDGYFVCCSVCNLTFVQADIRNPRETKWQCERANRSIAQKANIITKLTL
ncbi:MAG: hypothetical protein ACLSUT_02660 [Christensenellales bacterium]|mgnify:FL=1